MLSIITGPLGKVGSVLVIMAGAYIGFTIWLARHDAKILSGYVLQVEVDALQAQLDRDKALATKQLERDVKLSEATIEAAPDVLKGFEGMGEVATNLANIAQTMVMALTAPTEVIRDPQTGEIIGSRKQIAPPEAMN